MLGLLVYRLLGDRLAAFAAATLFALHPSHTESVSWATVPDPLLTLGLLLSLLFYLRYVDSFPRGAQAPVRKSRKAAENPGRSSGKWLAASAVAYFAALLSKETAIVFPAVILVLALSDTGNEDQPEARRRILVQIAVFGGITLLYFLLRWNALVANWLRRPNICHGSLNPGDFLHGRYVYLPLAGLSILVVTVLHLSAKLRPVLLGIAAAIAILFLPLTWAQEKQWQDDSTVFTTAHQLAPHNLPVARNLTDVHVHAALLIADDGRCGEAMPVFDEALGRYPDNWYAWAGRGICLVQSNDLVHAEEALHRAADLSQDPAVRQQWQALRAHMGLPTSSPTN